jgi:hypothetical protein
MGVAKLQSAKNSNRRTLLIVLLLVLLLIVCTVLFFTLNRPPALTVTPTAAPTVAAPTTETNPPVPTSAPAATVTVEPPSIRVLGAAPVLHLAGRSDIQIPRLDESSDIPLFECRDGAIIQETYPPGYQITPGSEFQFRASGQVNYYGDAPADGFLPDGAPNELIANIEPFGGISGYQGPAGALVGVFLDDAIPNSAPPEALNFGPDGLGTTFSQLEPQLGQVFFIGDGQTDAQQTQTFVAPTTATRLFIGLIDSRYFSGVSTCYADNTGSFSYQITSDQPYEALP